VRLLREAGVAFEQDPAVLDEAGIKAEMAAMGADVAELAGFLSEAKAKIVSERHPGSTVIGSDQILELGGKWFDKPGDRDEALLHLEKLRGRTHRLVCGVCVVRDGERLWRHVETARLAMRSFSDAFLADYVARTHPDTWQSVGGYRLEGLGAQLFERIDGDHFTIQGLPLLPLLRFLRREGLIQD